MSFRSSYLAGLAAFAALTLTGCGISGSAPVSGPQIAPIGNIVGDVHGGRQPIAGAHLYLFAAGSNGYDEKSVSLLTANGSATTLDNSGGPTNGDYYVTTGTGGSFSLGGDYTCTVGQEVYLYSYSGNPGSGIANPAAGLIAVLGICPASGSLAGSVPYVYINELSTIAAAYALAGFAVDATHISSPNTALALQGIDNAVLNSGLLYNIVNGGPAPGYTPNGLGSIPLETLSSLGNALAACINSISSTSTQCNSLFSAATTTGTSSGTAPTETATAAINIAHHPGSNVATIYQLPTGIGTPYLPALSTQPNDFTIAIYYTNTGFQNPQQIAIDGANKVYVKNEVGGEMVAVGPQGVPLPGSPFPGGTGNVDDCISIDPSGNVWVSNYDDNTVDEYTNSGTTVAGSPFTFNGVLSTPGGIAFDTTGNGYITSGQDVLQFNSSATVTNTLTDASDPLDNPTHLALDNAGFLWVGNIGDASLAKLNVTTGAELYRIKSKKPDRLAIDKSNNVWSVEKADDEIAEHSKTGVESTGSPFTGGGISSPRYIAIDGLGNAFSTNFTNNSISEISGGVVVSPSAGYTASGYILAPFGIAIDGSGDVWVANTNSTTTGGAGRAITEIIGIAAPAVTPLLPGTLGVRP